MKILFHSGGGEKRELFNGYKVSVLQDEKVLDSHLIIMNILNTTDLYT